MPNCAIVNCKNSSKRVGRENGDVSFHRFPKDLNTKVKWIEATGNKNWLPSKFSTICSIHFNEDDFVDTKKFRRLYAKAYPTVLVLNTITNGEKVDNLKNKEVIKVFATSEDSISINSEEENCNDQSHQKKVKRPFTPREKRLYDLVQHQRLKIKRFREQNRRKAKKIEDLETIINYLERKIKDQNHLVPD
ncbi:THAP domain-containing protein 1-like [Zerene cesonia]|uniref:THAP domain-containing protein 1-like n=1 Tax=Zerene cesonia TaxID=33412 RepID=UPI0018E57C89|nr:THAP domain-containing protein 1-like [Zerene cesonia]